MVWVYLGKPVGQITSWSSEWLMPYSGQLICFEMKVMQTHQIHLISFAFASSLERTRNLSATCCLLNNHCHEYNLHFIVINTLKNHSLIYPLSTEDAKSKARDRERQKNRKMRTLPLFSVLELGESTFPFEMYGVYSMTIAPNHAYLSKKKVFRSPLWRKYLCSQSEFSPIIICVHVKYTEFSFIVYWLKYRTNSLIWLAEKQSIHGVRTGVLSGQCTNTVNNAPTQ